VHSDPARDFDSNGSDLPILDPDPRVVRDTIGMEAEGLFAEMDDHFFEVSEIKM
jgi:hypothetical protein